MVFSNNLLMGAAGQSTGYTIDQSIRFNDNDSASLTRTPSSVGNRRTWTFSCWVKRANLTGANQPIFSAGGDDWLMFLSAETLGFNTSGSNYRIVTSQLFRDPGAWFHLVIRVDTTNSTAGDRLRLYINGSEVTDFGTDTNPTLNFDTAFNNTGEHRIGKLVGASQFFDGYLAEINHVDGSSLAPTEFGETDADTGQWVPKKYTGSYGTNGFYIDGATSTFLGKDAKATSAAVTNKASTSSEWGGTTGAYTFATNEIDRSSTVNAIISTDLLSGDFSFDFTMTTSGGALRVGVIDDQESNTFNGTGDDGGMDSMTNSWYLDKGNNQFRYGGASQGSASGVANGSAVTIERTGSTIKITDDGSDAHTFSQTFSGPVRVVISGGGAAFNLDNVQYTADGASGNDNSFFSSGLAAADQVSDSPTDNYATLNPLLKHGSVTLADGNLEASSSANGWFGSVGTVGVRLGDKVYFEGKCLTNTRLYFGLSRINGSGGTIKPESDSTFEGGQSDTDYMWRVTDANTVYYQTANQSVTVSAVSVNDIVGCSVDTNGTVKFYKNGTEIHSFSATLVAGDTYMPIYSVNGATSTEKWEVRFGSTGISHQPAGFSLLRTSDMADPTIADPSAYFDTLTWSGDSSNKNITGLNFKPDWLWIKQRNQAFSVGHQLYDVVRGAGSEKELDSSSAAAEGAGNPDVFGYPSAFVSGGFTATAGSSGDWDYVNKSGVTYVAWNWLADNTTGSTNTDGSINSTVSNNSTSNFSIVKYTGTGSGSPTVGHGLGVTPDMIIIKHLDRSQSWRVFHTSEGVGKTGFLNSTAAFSADSDRITAVSSTTFTAAANMNESADYIAYCFAEVEGFSKFGSYTGSGSSDGVFVHTGFEVGFLMYKRTNAAESWEMYDNTRGFNVHKFNLRANLSNAEQSDVRVDLLSNGFKARSSNTAINTSGSTYMYMAFATSPFKTATAQ